MMGFLKRRVEEKRAPEERSMVGDASGLMADCPALWEFLTMDKWDDGGTRVTGTLLLFADDGKLKAALRDRDGGWVTFASASDLETLLLTLDEGIQREALEWRKERPMGGNRGKRG